MWRYHPVLPIRDPAHFVSLGEGGTPLLDAPALARVLGVRRLLLKFEGTNPTGTMALTYERLVALVQERLPAL